MVFLFIGESQEVGRAKAKIVTGGWGRRVSFWIMADTRLEGRNQNLCRTSMQREE